MKHDQPGLNQSPKLSGAVRSAAVEEEKSGHINSAPTQVEVARRACFAYVNEGSQPGRELKHWLEAEVQLQAEIIHGNEHHAGL